jgi:hypothetical protein
MGAGAPIIAAAPTACHRLARRHFGGDQHAKLTLFNASLTTRRA